VGSSPPAEDTARFARMLLNRGEIAGRRYLSESAVAQISKRQTPESVTNAYGLGFAVGPDWFGHGGALATNLEIHPDKPLAFVWMVQHAGFLGEGNEAQGVFKTQVLNGGKGG
jgi:CubicO group peptidase (beta-lactamase class C family)